MSYVGFIVSAVLHVGGLYLLLTARAPDPLIPLGDDSPVAVDIISLDEYNALTSRAPTVVAQRTAPEPPRAPVLSDEDPLLDTIDEEPQSPEPSIELAMRLPDPVTDVAPEVEDEPEPDAPEITRAPAPKPLQLDEDALQDRGVDPADLGPPDDVRVATAPPAPKPPRGVADALPQIDTSSDEPPKPAETEGEGEEDAPPAPEPAATPEVVETAAAEDPAPLATPLPVKKPRGSLNVASTDEPSQPAPPAPAVEPEPAPQATNELTEAELEEERRLMAALMEQMRASQQPSAQELRAAEDEERRRLAEERARAEELAALDEDERRRREEEARAQAEADAEIERRARELAEQQEREILAQRARELAEQRRVEQEAASRAQAEAQRLAQEELDRQRREQERREREARELAARQQQLANLNATIAPENRADNIVSAPQAPQQDSFLGGDQSLASILGAASNAAQSASTGPVFGQGSVSGSRGAGLTPGETQAVLNQLRRCWRVDTVSANARNLVVTMRAQIRQNGFINQGTISLVSPNPVPPEYQIAVDRARTALQDLRCQPFALPPQKYNAWRDIVIRFDPAQMVLQ